MLIKSVSLYHILTKVHSMRSLYYALAQPYREQTYLRRCWARRSYWDSGSYSDEHDLRCSVSPWECHRAPCVRKCPKDFPYHYIRFKRDPLSIGGFRWVCIVICGSKSGWYISRYDKRTDSSDWTGHHCSYYDFEKLVKDAEDHQLYMMDKRKATLSVTRGLRKTMFPSNWPYPYAEENTTAWSA